MAVALTCGFLASIFASAAGGTEEVSVEISSYAADYDVSLDEAERRLDRIDALKRKVNRIRGLEESRLAGWGIVHEPNFGGWVYLVGDEPATKKTQRIARNDDEIIVELGATHRFDQLAAVLENFDNANHGLSETVLASVSSLDINMRNNTIEVGLDSASAVQLMSEGVLIEPVQAIAAARALPGEPADQMLEVEALRATDMDMDVAPTLAPVVVEFVERPMMSEMRTYHGGAHISVVGGRRCTAGFAATKGAKSGMLTAAHCDQNGGDRQLERHYNRARATPLGASALINNAPNSDSIYGYYGDVVLYTLAGADNGFSDDFHVQREKRKDLARIVARTDMFGDRVCHFGVNTGKSCGTVESITHAPRLAICGASGVCLPVWVRVEGATLIACGGDSGGPVHNDRDGYGIVTGGGTFPVYNGECSQRNTAYMAVYPLSEIESRLGVSVRTS